MKTIPTMKVVNEDSESGFSVINAEDFDPDTMEEFEGEETTPEEPNPLDSLTKDDMASILEEAGVDFNKNLGEKKLRAALEDAIKEEQEANDGESPILNGILEG